MAAKALSRHTHTNAFARGIHRSCRTSRAAAHNQHVVRGLGIELGGLALSRASVELGHNFLYAHSAGTKHLPIEEHHRHGHDLALFHFLLKCAAFNDHSFNLGVKDGHERKGLHHIRTVVAAQ